MARSVADWDAKLLYPLGLVCYGYCMSYPPHADDFNQLQRHLVQYHVSRLPLKQPGGDLSEILRDIHATPALTCFSVCQLAEALDLPVASLLPVRVLHDSEEMKWLFDTIMTLSAPKRLQLIKLVLAIVSDSALVEITTSG